MPKGGNMQPAIDNSEHIGPDDTGDNISAKKTANYVWDANTSQWVRETQPTAVSDTTDTIYSGSTALTPKWSTITASSSGVNTQVAAVTSKKIRVLALVLIASGTVNVKFQSHVTPTDKTGLFYLAANTGFAMPYNPKGWFETVSGEALDINLSGATAVGGVLQYIEV